MWGVVQNIAQRCSSSNGGGDILNVKEFSIMYPYLTCPRKVALIDRSFECHNEVCGLLQFGIIWRGHTNGGISLNLKWVHYFTLCWHFSFNPFTLLAGYTSTCIPVRFCVLSDQNSVALFRDTSCLLGSPQACQDPNVRS